MTLDPVADFAPGRAFAEELDAEDSLHAWRREFHFPKREGGDEPVLYFTGNSLGLMPKRAEEMVAEEMAAWRTFGVDGHFKGVRPWYGYHEEFSELAAKVVGAKKGEVVMMNSLTANLHFLMVSFYRPTKDRYRIVIEGGAFPSDRYAVATQASYHGFDPEDAVVELQPREGEDLLRTEDIEAYLKDEGDKVALVMLSGVNFYTGQLFDLERITKAAHDAGAACGFDLAHAAGNVDLHLHAWNVDFAAFCTYKYLNSGPGAVGGAFVHERHANRPELPRFAGWWGNDPETRFSMPDAFVPQSGAAGWQVSNAPVLSMAPCLASMQIFDEAGMENLREKSRRLTGYLEKLVDDLGQDAVSIITPREPRWRGCQLSLRVHRGASKLRDLLQEHGVVSDFRPPDVIRVAPVPLYNSFADVWDFADVLRRAVS